MKIDLDRHGLIEASAGTGKTYQIEQLFLRFILETAIEIRKILLVTFTEKAVGEMKRRLRGMLEEKLQRKSDLDGALVSRLQDGLDHFDEVPIMTIHAFCHKSLSQHEQEEGGRDLCEDKELFLSLLKRNQRREWRDRYGSELAQILFLSGIPGHGSRNVHVTGYHGEQRIAHLAKELSAKVLERVFPEVDGEVDGSWYRAAWEHLNQPLLDFMASERLSDPARLISGYEQLNCNAATRKANIEKVIKPLSKFLEAPTWTRESLQLALSLKQSLMDNLEKGRPAVVPYKWNKSGSNLEVLPELESLDQLMEVWVRELTNMTHVFISVEAHRLAEDVRVEKSRRGTFSFDDWIVEMDRRLSQEATGCENFIKAMRQQYRVAIVDEFQDTDKLQWRIFHKIFMASTGGQLLYMVGDPKQSIYGFRGADIQAFLQAREMVDQHALAKRYQLDVNYRSSAAMLTALNTFFVQSGLFGEKGGVQYQPVSSGRGEAWRLVEPDADRKPVELIELQEGHADEVRMHFAECLADEIGDLLDDHQPRQIVENEMVRPLSASDIAILVRSRSMMPIISRALEKKGIPTSFYKRTGLYRDTEVLHLIYLFEALARPEDRAALGKLLAGIFFATPLTDIPGVMEDAGDTSIHLMLDHWRFLATGDRWSTLFESIVRDSGVYFRPQPNSRSLHLPPRSRTNLEHIFEELLDVLEKERLDLEGLADRLRLWRDRGRVGGVDMDVYRLESERPAVRIMTIHAAKGLEFPVVILAECQGDRPKVKDYYEYHHNPEGNTHERVADLRVEWSQSDAATKCREEEGQENERLLYVAMTRARYKLYLPFSRNKNGSGILGILKEAISKAFPDLLQGQGEKAGWGLWRQPAADISMASSQKAFRCPITYASIREPHIKARISTRLHSYTSLANKNRRRPDRGLNEWVDKGMDLEPETHATAPAQAEPDFGGREVGVAIHELIENVHPAMVRDCRQWEDLLGQDSFASLLQKNIQRLALSPENETEVKNLLTRWCHAAYHAELPLMDGTVSLCSRDVQFLKEVEFIYPFSKKWFGVEGHPRYHNYIRGFVDVVLEFRGRYYLLDWKSNRLDTYDASSLSLDIQRNGYNLQANVYSLALRQWLLPQLDGAQSFSDVFGGMIFVYLRGLGEGQGLLRLEPDVDFFAKSVLQVEQSLGGGFETGQT